MSVNYRAVWAYGYLTDASEDFINEVCGKHNTVYCPIGNAYTSEVKAIISTTQLSEYFDGYMGDCYGELPTYIDPKEVIRIRDTIAEITGNPPQTDPKSYFGLYIF